LLKKFDFQDLDIKKPLEFYYNKIKNNTNKFKLRYIKHQETLDNGRTLFKIEKVL
jgi:hypothetical protein